MMSKQNNNTYKISSPNNWMNKIGISINKEGKMKLPPTPLTIAINEASRAIDSYAKSSRWEDKMREIKIIALNVRQAETTYFASWSNQIQLYNPHGSIPNSFPCYSCFLATISPNALRAFISPKMIELREKVNKEVIHAIENGIIFTLNFKLVESYYNSLLALDLFHFSECKNLPIKFCRDHVNIK